MEYFNKILRLLDLRAVAIEEKNIFLVDKNNQVAGNIVLEEPVETKDYEQELPLNSKIKTAKIDYKSLEFSYINTNEDDKKRKKSKEYFLTFYGIKIILNEEQNNIVITTPRTLRVITLNDTHLFCGIIKDTNKPKEHKKYSFNLTSKEEYGDINEKEKIIKRFITIFRSLPFEDNILISFLLNNKNKEIEDLNEIFPKTTTSLRKYKPINK